MSDRNYDDETLDHAERKYIYNFDKDVIHRFMMESFEPFIRPGNALELGCFEGEFSAWLSRRFSDLTCVDASGDAISKAKARLRGDIKFEHSRFEQVSLKARYSNIFLTHVLEHLADPIAVLSRINKEWLAEDGRFFLVCPNANAPSRQIAVKMGLVDHNSAVTDAGPPMAIAAPIVLIR
jgi:2-polyprenyl-3-methyl-5-hydroxy-6-metoxy-1,4-benzoquinol methylase